MLASLEIKFFRQESDSCHPKLPDFSWYNIPKQNKITSKLPNDHKITKLPQKYQMTTKLPSIHKITKQLPNDPKIITKLPNDHKITKWP
jgi:hypothetical protein